MIQFQSIASGVNQGGRAIFSNLAGAQRGFIGTDDSGDRGSVAATSAAGDGVVITSDSTASLTGLFIGGIRVVKAQEAAVGNGTAPDLTWSANEEEMLEEICQALENHGLIANSTCS